MRKIYLMYADVSLIALQVFYIFGGALGLFGLLTRIVPPSPFILIASVSGIVLGASCLILVYLPRKAQPKLLK